LKTLENKTLQLTYDTPLSLFIVSSNVKINNSLTTSNQGFGVDSDGNAYANSLMIQVFKSSNLVSQTDISNLQYKIQTITFDDEGTPTVHINSDLLLPNGTTLNMDNFSFFDNWWQR
jgi:hypothetical protein